MDLHFLLHVLHVNLKKKTQNQNKDPKQTQLIPNKTRIFLHNMMSVCSFLIKERTKEILSEENLNLHTYKSWGCCQKNLPINVN